MEVDDFTVAMVGRWIVYDGEEWVFNLDKSRMGRCINMKGINTYCDLEVMVKGEFGVARDTVFIELTYWVEDILRVRASLIVEPCFMRTDRDVRRFRSLNGGDKSVNLFVTFRELVGSELKVLGPVDPVAFGVLLSGVTQNIPDVRRSLFVEPDVLLDANSPSVPSSSYLTSMGISSSPDDDTLLAHMEAIEVSLAVAKKDKNGTGIPSDVENLFEDNSTDFESDDGEDSNSQSDYESEDYDYDGWDHFVRNDGQDPNILGESDSKSFNSVTVPSSLVCVIGSSSKEVDEAVVNSSSDDDFIDPPKKKFMLKSKKDKVLVPVTKFSDKIKKGITLSEIYGYEDIEPMFDDTGSYQLMSHKVDLSKEDDTIFVGREFLSREDFKIALSIYAINRVFRFKFVRFERTYLVAQCYDKNCGWRVTAHQIGDSDEYIVKKAMLVHVCDVNTRRKFSKHATSKIVAALLRSKYVNAMSGPRARDLPDICLEDHHIRLSYWKAWKLKELAVDSAQGTEESSYLLLPVYLHVLQLANPNTIYYLDTEKDDDGDDCFKYLFLALGSCVLGVKHLRRVVVVDGTHLHGKFKGVLLTASGQDSNFQIFPIAFAVVDSENDDAWIWFFEKLSQICIDGDDLTIVSDRQQSIYKAKQNVFPKSHHAACLVHLRRNAKAKFKKSLVAPLVWRAGNMFRVKDFHKIFERIKKRDKECWKWLKLVGLGHWTRAHFAGKRYNLMSSNIAESLNNAIFLARGSPIVAMLEFIRRMISRWFAARRVKISKQETHITPVVEKVYLKHLFDSVGFSVMAAGVWEYEVGDKDGERYHVSLEKKECTCLQFQMLDIPCRHAMAASGVRDIDYKTLVGEVYNVKTWAASLCGTILPVKDPLEVDVPEEIRVLVLSGPKTKRPPGRPPKLRISSIGEYQGPRKSQHPNKCGRCHCVGHNRQTCKQPIG